jgi:hypothetical protein
VLWFVEHLTTDSKKKKKKEKEREPENNVERMT